MKILVASMQVSESGSKGHLHPAIEIALEAKRRGHEAYLLPLPSRLGSEDEMQLAKTGIKYVAPPRLPESIIKSRAELAKLAASKDDVWKAYHSFLVSPLTYQFSKVQSLIDSLRPDMLIYDLLVYSAPFAARSLGIPDLGFCAGLKLVAPDRYQKIYKDISLNLKNDLSKFLDTHNLECTFKHLELLSERVNAVFATDLLVKDSRDFPANTHLVGPIHPSPDRGDALDEFSAQKKDFAVLSFGSVLDPADFPGITDAIIKETGKAGMHLYVGSKRLKADAQHITVKPYLQLNKLLPNAKIFIHHGGAGSFSEALFFGVPQLLIPLTTDQPIQGHFLGESKAGLSIDPQNFNNSDISAYFKRLADINDPIYTKRRELSQNYQSKRGQEQLVRMAEDIYRREKR